MTTDNLPVLYRNIMDSLPSDLACDAFLWATEKPGNDCMCYAAEKFALDVHDLVSRLSALLDAAEHANRVTGATRPEMNADQRQDLVCYIVKRHANLCYGGNVTPSYAERLT